MPRNEDGVSEIIGAVLLISVVVIGLSIVGATILTSPPPQKIPSMSADITRIGNTIYIRHDGGDTLHYSETRIFVDGSTKTSSFLQSGSVWSSFGVGDILYNNTDIQPNTDSLIQFVYTGGPAEQTIVSLRVP